MNAASGSGAGSVPIRPSPRREGSSAISNRSKAGSSYGCAARSAATTAARRSRGRTISSLVSATRSSRPTSPMVGFAPVSGLNWPVPAVAKEQSL